MTGQMSGWHRPTVGVEAGAPLAEGAEGVPVAAAAPPKRSKMVLWGLAAPAQPQAPLSVLPNAVQPV